MKILGLTGAIASGKNLVAKILQERFSGEVFDADNVAHGLLESDPPTIFAIKSKFPSCHKKSSEKNGDFHHSQIGHIDRAALSLLIAKNPRNLHEIEEILHPKIRQKYQEFLAKIDKKTCKLAILNIPLLLESRAYECDGVLAIIASKETRKLRFIARALCNNSAALQISKDGGNIKKSSILPSNSKEKASQHSNWQKLITDFDLQQFEKSDDLCSAVASWLDDEKEMGVALQLNQETPKKIIFGLERDLDLLSQKELPEFTWKAAENQGEKAEIERLEAKFEMLNQRQLSNESRIRAADIVLVNEN